MEDRKKEYYEKPELEIIELETEDIVTGSGDGGPESGEDIHG